MGFGLMQSVTSEARRKPSRVCLYAIEKWGKTSFGAQAPAPVFGMTRGEDGLVTLMGAGRLPPTAHFPREFRSWSDVTAAASALLNEDHDFRTFVLDTVNGAARLLAESVCEEHFNGSWVNFDAYGRGWNICAAQWIDWLDRLDALREDRGMSVILLAHCEVKPFKNPTGTDFDRYQPEVPKALWAFLHKWCDAILFGSFRVHEKTEGKGPGAKVKGTGGNQRVLFTGENAAYVGGNRYGLPPEIPCGNSPADAWKAFVNEMRKARAPEQQQKPAEKPAEKPAPPAEPNQKPAARAEEARAGDFDQNGNPLPPAGGDLFVNDPPRATNMPD